MRPEAVSDAFGLGRPRGGLRRVHGGLSHRTWRLDTDRGSFAVKELNRDHADPDYLPRYERAFAIELAAFEAGVVMPRPVPAPDGRCCAELPDGETVKVHAWVDGTVPPDRRAVSPDIADAIGRALAQIHGLELAADDHSPLLHVPGPRHWTTLASRADDAGIVWAERIRSMAEAAERLEVMAATAEQNRGRVLQTHRDVGQKNLLVGAVGRVFLVDWDVAGPWEPSWELAGAVLGCAGAETGEPDPAVARRLVAAYRAAGGAFARATPDTFTGLLVICANWIEYNVRRCLGERLQDEASRRIAETHALRWMDQLPAMAASVDAWTLLLR